MAFVLRWKLYSFSVFGVRAYIEGFLGARELSDVPSWFTTHLRFTLRTDLAVTLILTVMTSFYFLWVWF